MRNCIILIAACSLIVTSGCEKKLNIVPSFTAVEEIALSSTESIDAGISYAYAQLFLNVGTHHTLWAELLADHLLYKGTLNNYANYYNRDLQAVAEEQNANDLRGINNIKQREIYNCANTAALILRAAKNNVAASDPTFEVNKNRIMGECHFLRAVGNFQLLRFFSRPWGATADNSHPGIIINLEAVDNRESQIKARSSVAEVYAFIIEDLKKAEELLPDSYDILTHPAGYNGRAYKDGARAMLARVYFQQQSYPLAKETIDRTIGASTVNMERHPLAADLNEVFGSRGPDSQNPENIFMSTAAVLVNGLSTFWWNSNTTIYKIGTTTSPSGMNGVASNSFIQQANYSGADQRKVLLFSQLTSGELMPRKYGLANHVNMPIIRSAELILDRSEINALDNKLVDAVNDINKLRARAQISLLPTTITQGPLIDSIRRERVRELCFEGDRLWDLKRRRQPIPAGDRTNQTTLEWDGLTTVLKYFSYEQDRNPLLENNY